MLRVQAEELADGVVLHLKGRILNGAETMTLRGAVFSRSAPSIVVLDLSQVDVIDAGGLSALLDLRQWTQANGIGFKLVNPTRLVQRVLEITCLDSVFDISFRDGVPFDNGRDGQPPIIAVPMLTDNRGADRGPQAGSPLGVVDATGFGRYHPSLKRSRFCRWFTVAQLNPVAIAPRFCD